MIKVTNKRIIISFSWFGIHSFTPALSCFYKKSEWQRFGSSFGHFGDAYVLNCNSRKGRFLGNYIRLKTKNLLPLNIKIYTDKNKEMENIIKKYS